jgi:hypothetical protein
LRRCKSREVTAICAQPVCSGHYGRAGALSLGLDRGVDLSYHIFRYREMNMLYTPTLEYIETAEAPTVRSTPPETRNDGPEVQREAFEFIARQVLERGADFFDG